MYYEVVLVSLILTIRGCAAYGLQVPRAPLYPLPHGHCYHGAVKDCTWYHVSSSAGINI